MEGWGGGCFVGCGVVVALEGVIEDWAGVVYVLFSLHGLPFHERRYVLGEFPGIRKSHKLVQMVTRGVCSHIGILNVACKAVIAVDPEIYSCFLLGLR
jgi:hypothetical protein